MRIDQAADELKEFLKGDEALARIPIIINDYGTDPANEEASKVLSREGLVITIFTFSATEISKQFNVQVICSIAENPQQRDDYIRTLQAPIKEGDDYKALQVVHSIFSLIRDKKKYNCGTKPIELAPPLPCERVLSESGRVQFDVRINIPAS